MEGVSDATPAAPARQHETPAGEPPAGPGYDRRLLALALLLGALGAGLALLATGRTWAAGTTSAAAATTVPVSVSGDAVTGLPDALALVGLAALVAVFAVRGASRVLVAALLALCGAGTVWAAVAGAADTSALDAAAGRASGLTASTVHHASHTGWPYVAAAGGVLLLVAGLLALARGRTWPAMSSRYERDGTPRPRRAPRRAPDPEHPGELWKALDRGEDPTLRDPAGDTPHGA